MKYFLMAGILGFASWALSEALEIYQSGYSPPVYYLTALYHVFAGFGVWGLHKAQSKHGGSMLSFTGATITLIAFLCMVYFPIAVMNSGLSITGFFDVNPAYKVPAALWFAGMTLFGISILKTKHFPTWTGVVFLLGTIVFTATPLLKWPTLLANVTNSVFAATVIYMCFTSLRNFHRIP